ncbi:inositol monophosphatase family protein [Acidothermaceae bacterium B102]|nr:inositol monophosphatase family protein [Acidothermaceae bacterium B102]
MTDLDALLTLATDIAHETGALILDRDASTDLAVQTKSTDTDVVTAKDTAAERLIRARLDVERPDDGFLGEESGHGTGSTGVRWIVDPIDGTVNYLYNIPQYAVSIGVEIDGVVQVGVVYDPAKDEMYQAISGGGSTLNGATLACSTETVLSQSLVCTGFGYAAARRTRQAEILLQVIPHVRDIRRMGAASLDLCAVAAGRADGYYERGLNPWDVAAGVLIAQEAGAVVTDIDGAFPTADFVLAAAAGVHKELLALLAPLRPDLS